MDEKELKILMDEISKKNGESIKSAVKTEMEAACAGLMKSSELASKFEAMGLTEKTIKSLTDAVEKQGLELQKVLGGKQTEVKSLEEQIHEKKEAIQKIGSGGAGVKIQLPVNKTQVARSSVSGSTMAMRLVEVGQLPYLGAVMTNLFRHAPVSASSNGVIRYFDQNAITRNAASVAEGATKPESAITWIERTLTLEKIADSIPVSKEAWQDVYFIQSEIDRLLNVNLALKEDALLWSGDGVTPNIKGVYTSAPTFSASTWVSGGGFQPATANIYDLIEILRTAIVDNAQSKYNPNYVILNPSDTLGMKLTKDSQGRYLLPPFISADGKVVGGMTVIESSQVTKNTMLVGDFNYGTIYDLEGVTIEMGFVNDQFIKNAMTMLAEKREGLLIRTVDTTGFLKVTSISAALTTLTHS